ncbi:MAG: response regulator [Desulfonatronovibrio sp.]
MSTKTILIVDDEPGFRFSVSLILRNQGFKVVEAGDGIQALEVMSGLSKSGEAVDLVISDIRMPGMDGLKFLERLSAGQDRIKIIVMTGYGNRETGLALKRLGITRVINKPFNAEVLLDSVYSSFDK